MSKIAVIDIGSNSVRMQISEVFGKSYKIVEDYKKILRIGDNVFQKGFFDEKSVDNLVIVLKNLKSLIIGKNVDTVKIVATAAFREANNAFDVVDRVKKEIDFDIEIIPGEKEAFYNYLSATANFQLSKNDAVVVDVGGGSTEICITKKGDLIKSISLEVGCSKLTKLFIKHNPPTIEEILNLKRYINDRLEGLNINSDIDLVISSGGTMYNLSEMYYKEKSKENEAVKYVDRKYLKKMISYMSIHSIDEIKKLAGIEPQRSDIMLAAMIFIDILLEKTRLSGFYTMKAGLRTGLTIDTINKMGIDLPFQNGESVIFSRLIEIGNKFNFEEDHARQVNKLALRLFDLLMERLSLDKNYKNILEASAILHDVGTFISYSGHHKHSYYLIKNSELLGFSPNEIELIANIARYHRRSVPKPTHKPYNDMTYEEKLITQKLAAILRIADGLDRSHNDLIKDIHLTEEDKALYIKPISKSNIYLEIEGANRKKDLLENILGKNVIIK
ncbi:MAG: Ppx/GppA phosphatase family protein [Deferribacterota bacterium]|nr:Ppx/GppA phosphatase family protein [Deferribacterota bacterium]